MGFQDNLFLKDSFLYPLHIENYKQAPTCSAVYFLTSIVDGTEILYYIGSSGWVRQRLINHSIIKKLNIENNSCLIYIIPTQDAKHSELEKWLIGKLQPILNIRNR